MDHFLYYCAFDSDHLLRLKMRPDTPQLYEYIAVEGVEGNVNNFININPWTQFFDLKGRKDIPLSFAEHITMKDCKCECQTYFAVKADERQYHLSDFVFENLDIKAVDESFDPDAVQNMVLRDVRIFSV